MKYSVPKALVTYLRRHKLVDPNEGNKSWTAQLDDMMPVLLPNNLLLSEFLVWALEVVQRREVLYKT
jgi:hypothetical protein